MSIYNLQIVEDDMMVGVVDSEGSYHLETDLVTKSTTMLVDGEFCAFQQHESVEAALFYHLEMASNFHLFGVQEYGRC